MGDRPPRIQVSVSQITDIESLPEIIKETAAKAGERVGAATNINYTNIQRIYTNNLTLLVTSGENRAMNEETNIHAEQGSFVNVKGEQIIENVRVMLDNSTSNPDPIPDDVKEAISGFLDIIEGAKEKDKENVEFLVKKVEELTKLVSKPAPERNTTFLTVSAEGLKEAAKAIGDIVPRLVVSAEIIAVAIANWLR